MFAFRVVELFWGVLSPLVVVLDAPVVGAESPSPDDLVEGSRSDTSKRPMIRLGRRSPPGVVDLTPHATLAAGLGARTLLGAGLLGKGWTRNLPCRR